MKITFYCLLFEIGNRERKEKCRDIFSNETLGAERNKLLYEPRNSVFRYGGFSECITFPNSTHGVTANKVRFQHVNALEFIYITVDHGC